MSAHLPLLPLNFALRREWHRARRHLGGVYRQWFWRPAPQTDAYLAALETPLQPDLVLWQGDGAALATTWAALQATPAGRGLRHVLALSRPELLPAAPSEMSPEIRRVAPGSPEHARLLARAARVMTDGPLPLWALRRSGQSLVCLLPEDAGAAERAHSLRQCSFAPLPGADGPSLAKALLAPPELPAAGRPQIALFGGGWKSNGITASLLNLLEALAEYDLDLHLVTDARSDEAEANLRRLDPRIQVIRRATLPMRRAEQAALARFQRHHRLANPAQITRMEALFQREARRLFGERQFDAALDFSGYAREWSLLIAATPARRRVIWQHNHLHAEAERRFDSLKGVFATYPGFDAIASVSEETRRVNLEHLGHHYPDPERAVTIRNLINPAALCRQAAAPLPAGLHLPATGPLFVMAGRLSPEKAQHRALHALAQLGGDGARATLILLGSGPLEAALRATAQRLGLTDRVIFAGHLDNPFAVIARADCFLLSSDYEGQPMVLLEALTLGKPVIATDMPGARSVLGGLDGPLLVAPTVAGLADGMRRFLAGEVLPAAFDAEAYRAAALAEFFHHVLGYIPAKRVG
jgi:CDP-glycerol glycerophosphotransferase